MPYRLAFLKVAPMKPLAELGPIQINADFSQTTQVYTIGDTGETPEEATLTFNASFTEFRLPIEAEEGEESPLGISTILLLQNSNPAIAQLF